MAILKTFLCMCNTRTGSLISGCYTLAISLLCMVYYLFRYVGHKLVEDSAEYKGIIYVGFVLYGFMIVSSLVIIPGVQLDKRYLLLPWIYIVILVVLYDTGSVALLTTVHMERDETLQVSEILWVFFYLFRLAANCYCFTCVVSQYQELSDGRGTYDYFYKPRRRARLQNGNHFDIDTYDLPFGVHLPPYTEQDGTENNPPSYDKIYPNSDQSAAENSSSANNFVEIELNHPTHSNNDRYINHQLSMNDSGFIELNDQNEENGQRRQQRVENFSQRVENFSQRMENFSQGIENFSRGTENFNPESGASNLYTESNVIDSLCSNHHHRTYHESQLCRYYGRRHSNADGNRYEVTVNIEWI